MLIGKQFSIWKKQNATSSSNCQIQYFAGAVHINTPTIYCLFQRTTERITQMHREGISLIDRTVINTPRHIYWTPAQQVKFENAFLQLQIKLTSSTAMYEPSFVFLRDIKSSIYSLPISWIPHKLNFPSTKKRVCGYAQSAYSSYLLDHREAELSWLTTTTTIQLCRPCGVPEVSFPANYG